MPEFTYARQVPRSYTEARDQAGVIVGTVELGGKREFDTGDKPEGAASWNPVPDECWVASGEPVPPAWDGVSAAMYRLPEDDGESGSEDDKAAEPASTSRVAPARPPAPTPPATTTADGGQKDEG